MQAIMVIATLGLLSLKIPPLSILSLAGVALVTLTQGTKEGLLALFIAAVLSALLAIFLLNASQYQYYSAYTDKLFSWMQVWFTLWLPVWIIAAVLRFRQNMAEAITIAVFMGVLGVVGFYGFSATTPAEYWKQILDTMVEATLLPIKSKNISADYSMLDFESISHFMTGIIVVVSVLGASLGLMLGRWWQAQLFNPYGFAQEFTRIKVGQKFTIGVLLVVAVAMINEGSVAELAWNISMPWLVLYMLVGVAIVHVMLGHTKNAKILIPLFYGAMFIFSAINPIAVIMPIAFVGLSDPWVDLRAKVLSKTK